MQGWREGGEEGGGCSIVKRLMQQDKTMMIGRGRNLAVLDVLLGIVDIVDAAETSRAMCTMESTVQVGLWVKGERDGERERERAREGGDQAQTVVAGEKKGQTLRCSTYSSESST